MKKITTILSLMMISIMFIAGCSSSNKTDSLYLSNCSDNMIEMGKMGKKYFVNNLKDGDYGIEFIAKEYEYGILKKEQILYKSTINHNSNNNTLKIGVTYDESSHHTLKAIINDAEYGNDNLEFLKNGYETGMSMSILNEDKHFNLDEEVAIVSYSIGGEDGHTEGITIDGAFEIGNNNLTDLVVYIKLHKIN